MWVFLVWMGVLEIFGGMGKSFKVCRYAFYLFESYKQIKCARSVSYALLTKRQLSLSNTKSH